MYDPPMTNLPAALAQIDRVNTRLAHTNIVERFTYVLDPYTHEETNALGITTAQQRVHLTPSAPQIGFGGWVFVARPRRGGSRLRELLRTGPEPGRLESPGHPALRLLRQVPPLVPGNFGSNP